MKRIWLGFLVGLAVVALCGLTPAEAQVANGVAAIGAKTDAKSTATDTTAASLISIMKQISASVQSPPSQAVTAVSGAIANGAVVALGSTTDAKNAATDGTAITLMSVMKEISSVLQSAVITTGTAGSASAQVLTVQGVASMTPLLSTETPQAASGGTSLFTLTLAASTNATNIKASAGQLYSISGFNMSSATPIWVSLYNNAGTPTCGTGIIQQFLIPGSTTGTGFVYSFPDPKAFATGIAICATTGIAGTGNAAATTYVVNVDYK